MIWALIGLLAIILSCLQDLAIVAGVLILVVVGLAIVVYFAKGIKWLWDESIKTLKLADEGLKRKFKIRKLSASLKRDAKAVDTAILRLQQLRGQKLDSASIKRFDTLVHLLADCSDNDEYVHQCVSAIEAKRNVLTEISTIETQILTLSQKYQEIGNAEKCAHYLGFLSEAKGSIQLTTIQAKCNLEADLRNKEAEAIKRVGWTSVAITIGAVLICVASYSANTPYREFKSAILERTLTEDMVQYARNEEDRGVYYEVLRDDKGKSIVNQMLNRFKGENNVEAALWLLYTVDYSPYDDDISSTTINKWIIDYCMSNGEVTTDEDKSYKDNYYSIDCEIYGYRVSTEYSYGIDYSEMRVRKSN